LKNWWLRIPYTWRLAIVMWLGMRIVLWAFGATIFHSGLFPIHSGYSYGIDILSGPFSGALFGVWTRWDGAYYNLILSEGYNAIPQLSAFWPLYPMISRPLYWLGIHPNIALILSSNLAFLFGLYFYLKESAELFGTDFQKYAGLALILFPGAFYFYTPYPQSYTFLFIILTWRLARQRMWLAASVTGLLSGLTHSTSIPLAILLMILILFGWRKSQDKLKWVQLAIPMMPIMGVAVFVAWRIHMRFLPMTELLSTYWHSNIFNPFLGVSQLIDFALAGNVLSILKIVIIIFSLCTMLWLFQQHYYILGFYQIFMVGYLISFTTLEEPLGSFIRYFMMSFPAFMVLGVWMKNKKIFFRLTLVGCTLINLLLCGLYLSWVFVA
jgi:hypothetical protein